MKALIDLGNEDIIYLGIEYCNLIDLDVIKAFKLAVSLDVCGKGFYRTLVQHQQSNIIFRWKF